MNHNMRKRYSEEQVVELVKESGISSKLYEKVSTSGSFEDTNHNSYTVDLLRILSNDSNYELTGIANIYFLFYNSDDDYCLALGFNIPSKTIIYMNLNDSSIHYIDVVDFESILISDVNPL